MFEEDRKGYTTAPNVNHLAPSFIVACMAKILIVVELLFLNLED